MRFKNDFKTQIQRINTDNNRIETMTNEQMKRYFILNIARTIEAAERKKYSNLNFDLLLHIKFIFNFR